MSDFNWQVANQNNEVLGKFLYPEDAAAFVDTLGNGATILWRGTVVWREGKEEFPAGKSFDSTANIVLDRITKLYDDGE